MNYEIVLATSNKHKLEEVRSVLAPHGIVVYGLSDLGIKSVPEENGKTYYENALIKAKDIQKYTSFPIIADDSGLEIVSMDNAPGIQSRRFADSFGGHPQAFEYIFKQIEGKDRSARFVCDLAVLNIEDKPLKFEGICEGKLAEKPYGGNGFGYDPIFIPDGENATFAEISDEKKNKISHRGRALIKLLTYLKINGLIKK